MKQALAAPVIPVPESTPDGRRDRPKRMKNGNNKETLLEAVRPGDVLTLKRFHFQVLSSQRQDDLVTLELDDSPEQPLTLIGVPSMAVSIEPRHDSQTTPCGPDGH
jgi:hypothetical protein